MKQVESPYMRNELILNLMDLMDEEYQMREWLKSDSKTIFGSNMSFPFDFFDDLNLFEYLDKKEAPINEIGNYLKDEREAEIIYKVAYYLDYLCINCGTNEEFLASPSLSELRKASKEAFEIFMSNEQDNKELLEYIEKAKKDEKRTW